MTQFTEKQQAFVVNKAAGMKNREAAVAAGYAPAAADVTGAKLMGRSDIKAAITRTKRGGSVKRDTKPDEPDEVVLDERSMMPKARYTDAKEFLMDAMNHPRLPVAARAEYAKALLPYQHGKVGDTGKKEATKDRAKKLSDGNKAGRPKFATKTPPPLRLVGSNGG